MNTDSVLIRFENVRCTYHIKQGLFRFKPYHALRNSSFEVRQGETLGIIGRNGAGKTTILKLMCGILKPDAGRIHIRKGIVISLLGMQVGFDPELSGRENILLGGLYLGIPKSHIDSRMDDIIAFSELEAFIDNPIKTYSSGMRSRLGFSIGLELAPDVLLIDEILGVGDYRFQQKATDALQHKMKNGKTVVLVSHNLQQVESLCDRVVWIENGETQAEGDSKTVLERYKSMDMHPQDAEAH